MHVDNPAYPHISCVDVSINAGGPDEDKIYALHPDYEKNIRRGNTYLDLYDAYDYNLHKGTVCARKGLMKFYDLKPEYLVDDADFRAILAKKGVKAPEAQKVESNLRNYIFAKPISELNKEACIEVVKSLKINGENAQISWVQQESVWCIASKNVGILANKVDDLKKYDSKQGSRYNYAVKIARCWFRIIQKLGDKKISLAKLQQTLSGKTLVGEYVGNKNEQHIVKYPKETIIFYAITENDSSQNCLLPEESYKIFEEFDLERSPVETVGVFDNIDSLSEALMHEYDLVQGGSIQNEEEGAVIYLVSRGLEEEQVTSLCKLKSTEYRLFRKLREKLRNFWRRHANAPEWTPKLKEQYDNTYNKFVEESRKLVKDSKFKGDMTFYEQFADRAFMAVLQNTKLYDKMIGYYADFLADITYDMNEDHTVFTSRVFEESKSKSYTKEESKLNSLPPIATAVDNDSWKQRKINSSYFPQKGERKANRRKSEVTKKKPETAVSKRYLPFVDIYSSVEKNGTKPAPRADLRSSTKPAPKTKITPSKPSRPSPQTPKEESKTYDHSQDSSVKEKETEKSEIKQ